MSDHSAEYLQAYGEFAKVIRTWFVAYGIGAPVLFLTNEKLSIALKQSGSAKCIAALFMAGVAFQVVIAAANKFSMWGIYYAEINSNFKRHRRYKIAYWFSEAFWIDLITDLATMGLFGWATWRVFAMVFLNA